MEPTGRPNSDRHGRGRCSLGVLALLTLTTSCAVVKSADTARTADARIDAVFSDYTPTVPGCAIGVVRDGQLLHAKGHGAASLEYGVPLTPDSVFHIASGSKPFTALAVLLLVRDGKLSLDDDVRRYLPELPDVGRPVTVRQLLTHTSGLRDAMTLVALSGRTFDDTMTAEDLLALIFRQRGLDFEPGTSWMYSNTGFLLAAELIRRVSGQGLRAFTDARIFRPLGMAHTHFADRPFEVIPSVAAGYSPGDTTGFRTNQGGVDVTGAAGVYTTVNDLVRWDAAFYDASSPFAPLLAQLQAPVILPGGKQVPWGMSLILVPWNGHETVEQGGNWAGYQATLLRLPKEHYSVICLCNRSDVSAAALARRVAALDFPPAPDAKTAPPSTAPEASGPGPKRAAPMGDWRAHEGHYYSEELDVTYTLSARDGAPLLRFGHIELTLRPESRDRLVGDWLNLDFTAEGFTLQTDRAKNLVFREVR